MIVVSSRIFFSFILFQSVPPPLYDTYTSSIKKFIEQTTIKLLLIVHETRSNWTFYVLMSSFRVENLKINRLKLFFPSDSFDMNNNEAKSQITRHINRHYVSIKSNVRRHRKMRVQSFDNLPEQIPSNPRRIKQFRHEFIRKWTDDARQTYAQKHIIPSPSSNQLVQVNLKKHERKSPIHPSSSSSTELCNDQTKAQATNSISLSSNNNAFVYLQPRKSNENIECKIS